MLHGGRGIVRGGGGEDTKGGGGCLGVLRVNRA